MKKIVVFLLPLIIVIACSDRQNLSREDHFQLDNGLSVILRYVSGAKLIAIVTSYSIGENHDPAGKCGMAHLIEHLYVTAAAGDRESCTVQEFMARYPDGWNAQTGNNYTIIATVIPKEQMEAELRDAAARMSKLDIKESNLKREVLRIENELSNMYSGIPALAAQNLASDMVVAHSPNTRCGGLIKQIKSIAVEQINKRLKACYKPVNALLVIAGAIDLIKVKKEIEKNYSACKRGEHIEAALLPKKVASILTKTVKVDPTFPQAQSHVALAFSTPDPSDKLFPAFLAIVARLKSNAFKLNPAKGIFPIGFALLDRPEVVTVHLSVPEGQKAFITLDKLRNYVSATVCGELKGQDIQNTKNVFGYMLGLQEYADQILVRNIYGVAFTLARQKQLRIKSQELLEKLDSVTQDELSATVKKYFTPGKYATAIVFVNNKKS